MSRTGSYNKNNSNYNNSENRAKKKLSCINIFFRILLIIYFIMTILFLVYIASLNMLPMKYFIVLIVLALMVLLPVASVLLNRKRKYVGKVFCTLIMIFFASCYGFAYNYLNKTFNFISTMSSETVNEEVEEYYILAKSGSKYSGLEDINKINIGIFNITENIKNEILTKVKLSFEKVDNLQSLYANLLDGKIELAFVSSSQYGIMLDENEELKSKTKIIYTLTHKVQTEQKEEIKDTESKHTVEQGTFNVYISGIDTSGDIRNVSRSDANIIATVNIPKRKILLTSIPRDYYVTLHSYKVKDKLTHSGIYGINETVTTVEDLLGVDINYYVRVNFTTVIKMVDVIGGINVNSDVAFSAQGYRFVKGKNHLNGEQALAFSRERRSFADGDRQRGKNQQKVINAIITKLTSSSTLLTQYSNLLNSLSRSFQTNISQDEISYIIKDQLNNMTSWNVSTISLDGMGKYAPTYSSGSQKLYVMEPNVETVDNAKEKINALLNNE